MARKTRHNPPRRPRLGTQSRFRQRSRLLVLCHSHSSVQGAFPAMPEAHRRPQCSALARCQGASGSAARHLLCRQGAPRRPQDFSRRGGRRRADLLLQDLTAAASRASAMRAEKMALALELMLTRRKRSSRPCAPSSPRRLHISEICRLARPIIRITPAFSRRTRPQR